MIDACNAKNVPRDALIVAGYVDGKCKWSQADWDMFPDAIKVGVSSIGSNNGEALDVEPQNLNAREAVGWVRWRRAAGIDPTVYTAEWAKAGTLYGPGYSYADCVREFNAAGEPQPHYWIAPLDRRLPDGSLRAPYIPDWPGVIAAQWDYPGPIDRNIVADYWPGIDRIDMAFTDEFNKMVDGAGIPGVSGASEPGQKFLAALLDTERNDYNNDAVTRAIVSQLPNANSIAAEVVKQLPSGAGGIVHLSASDIASIASAVLSSLKAQWVK